MDCEKLKPLMDTCIAALNVVEAAKKVDREMPFTNSKYEMRKAIEPFQGGD